MTSGPVQFCSQCGFRLTLDARFCAQCGTALVPFESAAVTASSPHPAGLLPPAAPTEAPQPPPPPSVPAPAPVPPVVASRGRGVVKWLAIGAGVAVVGVAGVVGYRLLAGGETETYYLALPNRDYSVDVYAVEPGADISRSEAIAEEVSLTSVHLHASETDGKNVWGEIMEMSHGPVSVRYDAERDDYTLVSLNGELTEMARLGSEVDAGYHAPSGSWRVAGNLGYHEDATADSSCHSVGSDGDTRRVARGQWCSWSPSYDRVVVVTQRGEAWDILVLDADGEEVFTVEDVVGPHHARAQWSASGDRLAVEYTAFDDHTSTGFVEIYTSGGELLHELDIGSGGLATWGVADTFVVATQYDTATEVIAFGPDGGRTTLRRYSDTIDRFPSVYSRQVGQQVAVSRADGPAYSISIHDLATGRSSDVVDVYDPSERYVYVPWDILSDGRVLALSDGRVLLGDVSGVSDLGRVSTGDDILRVYESPGGTVIVLIGGTDDDFVEEVAVYRLAGDELVELDAGAQDVWNLSLSEDETMLAYSAGAQGDRNVYVVPLDGSARPDALDSSRSLDWVKNLRWDGDGVVYSVSTGDGPTDYEVRKARMDGSSPEVLYEDAYLLTVAGEELLRTSYVADE